MPLTPPTLISVASTAYNVNTTPKTLNVAVQSGDLLVVTAVAEDTAATFSLTTTGLTWTLRQEVTTGSYTRVAVWTAPAASTTTYTISLAETNGTFAGFYGMTAYVYRDHGGVGASSKTNNTGAPSLALTTTSDNSAVIMASGDWNAIDGTTRTKRTINGSTGTESLYGRDSANYTRYGAYWDDAGTAGSVTTGHSAPTGQKYSIVALEVIGTALTAQTLSPSGIASGEAFGTPALTVPTALAPSGVGTGQAFGSPSLLNVNTLTPTGVGTGEAFGTPALTNLNTLTPTGITTGAAFGTPTLVVPTNLQPTGINDPTTFGTPTLTATLTVSPGGIGTGEAFGVPSVGVGAGAVPVGIASGEAFGTPTLTVPINARPRSIPGGTGNQTQTNLVKNSSFETNITGWASLSGAAISRVNEQAYDGAWSAKAECSATNQGIYLSDVITPITPGVAYIFSGWVMGEPGKSLRLDARFQDSGGGGLLDVQSSVLTTDGTWQRIDVTGTAPTGATRVLHIFRNVTAGAHTFYVDAVMAEESTVLTDFYNGDTAPNTPFYTYAWTGTAHASTSTRTGAQFGTPAITWPVTMAPGGISSGEAFGTPALTRNVTLQPTGINDPTTFGTPTLVVPVNAQPTGISTGGVFGVPTVANMSFVGPTVGIASGEAFGTPTVVVNSVLTPTGIATGAAFGQPTLNDNVTVMLPTGITGLGNFGTPVIAQEDWHQIIERTWWKEAVNAHQRIVGNYAEMIDDNDEHVMTIPISGGSIDYDGEAAEQWGCSLTVVGEDWVPRSPKDPLDPRSSMRCRLWWRLQRNGGWISIPVGTYILEDPQIRDDGTVPVTTVKGADPLTLIRRNGYGNAVVRVGGLTIPAALERIFEVVASNMPIQIDSTSTVTLPAVYELTGGDPLDDLTNIAAQANLVIRTNRMGKIVCSPEPDLEDIRADWQEGDDCPVIDMDRDISSSNMVNSVTVVSTSPEVDPPISVTVEDTDPASPTWIGGKWGRRSITIRTDSVATVEGATALATATLNGRRRPMETITVEVPGRGDLGFRDPIKLHRAASSVADTYRISKWTLPLGSAADAPPTMNVTMMSRSTT